MSVNELAPDVAITEPAKQYIKSLLKDEEAGTGIKIIVYKPATQDASLELSFCPPNAAANDDVLLSIDKINLYIDSASCPYLKNAVIDYDSQDPASQLTVKAPYIKGKPVSDDQRADLREQLLHTINAQINPNLAMHGGRITLVDLKNKDVYLKFAGGCHGCSMAKSTLKNGIEKLLREKFPELDNIVDVTDHSTGADPFFT